MKIIHLYRPEEPKIRKPTKKELKTERVQAMIKEQRFKDRQKILKEYEPKFKALRERIRKATVI